MSIQEFEAAYAKLEEQLQAAAKAKAKAKANAKANGPSGGQGSSEMTKIIWFGRCFKFSIFVATPSICVFNFGVKSQ